MAFLHFSGPHYTYASEKFINVASHAFNFAKKWKYSEHCLVINQTTQLNPARF